MLLFQTHCRDYLHSCSVSHLMDRYIQTRPCLFSLISFKVLIGLNQLDKLLAYWENKQKNKKNNTIRLMINISVWGFCLVFFFPSLFLTLRILLCTHWWFYLLFPLLACINWRIKPCCVDWMVLASVWSTCDARCLGRGLLRTCSAG